MLNILFLFYTLSRCILYTFNVHVFESCPLYDMWIQCFFFSTFRTELVVYLQEKLPNSTIKRVPASTLYQNMKSVSQQLQAKQVIQCVPKASMSEIQLQNYLKTPPAGLWMLIIFILTSSKLFFHNFSTFYFDLFNRTIYMISLTVGHRFLET